MHRAGQGDVDQAHELGCGFQPGLGARRDLVERRVDAAAKVDHRRAVVVVSRRAFQAVAGRAQPAVPQKGAEHHRVLQALALVDGDDLHQVAVALQPQLGGLVGAGAAFALGLQPAQQGLGRRLLGGRLVQAFGQVQQVGQAARAIGSAQQALRHLFLLQPLAQHEADAAASPPALVLHEALQQRRQRGLVGRQGVDLRRVVAHPAGGQRGFQQAFAGGLQHGGQQPFQLFGIGAAEDAGLRQLDTAHAQPGQRQPHPAALGVAAHQHRDVAGAQRPIAQRHGASRASWAGRARHARHARRARSGGRGRCQQAGDLAGADRSGRGHRVVFGQRLAAARIGGQRPDLQRGPRLAGIVQRRLRPRALGHCVVGQPGLHKSLRVEAEQPVLRADQRLARALVGQQRVAGTGQGAGPQIGVQIGMTEAVDRLLGVADQAQRRRRWVGRRASTVDRLEDRELQRVGVLELVDQRRREAFEQRCGQHRPVRVGQPLVQVEQHVVEGDHALAALGRTQLLGAVGDQPAQQAQPGQRQLGLLLGQRIQQCLRRVEKIMGRRGAAFFGAPGQHAAAKQRQLGRQRGGAGRRLGAGQHRSPAGLRGQHAVLAVGAAVELAQPGQQGVGDRGRVRPPQPAGGVEGTGHRGRGGAGLGRRGYVGRPDQPRQRPCQLALQQAGVVLGAVAAGQQMGHQRRVGLGAGDFAAPEIVHGFQSQRAVVG